MSSMVLENYILIGILLHIAIVPPVLLVLAQYYEFYVLDKSTNNYLNYNYSKPKEKKVNRVTYGTRPGMNELVPVAIFINPTDTGLGRSIHWETYKTRQTDWDYDWRWVQEESQMGWVEKINSKRVIDNTPDPEVTVFCSEAMRAKLPELLGQNDNK